MSQRIHLSSSNVEDITAVIKYTKRFITLAFNGDKMIAATEDILTVATMITLEEEMQNNYSFRLDKNVVSMVLCDGYFEFNPSLENLEILHFLDKTSLVPVSRYTVGFSISTTFDNISKLLGQAEYEPCKFPNLYNWRNSVDKSKRGIEATNGLVHTVTPNYSRIDECDCDDFSIDTQTFAVISKVYTDKVKTYRLSKGVLMLQSANTMFIWREQYKGFSDKHIQTINNIVPISKYVIGIDKHVLSTFSLNKLSKVDKELKVEFNLSTETISIGNSNLKMQSMMKVTHLEGKNIHSFRIGSDMLRHLILNNDPILNINLFPNGLIRESNKSKVYIGCEVNYDDTNADFE